MNGASRKRSAPLPEESRAECPFNVTVVTPGSRIDRTPRTKKPKREAVPDDAKLGLTQKSLFEPHGKFKKYPSMDVRYVVEPRRKWADMTRYNCFVLNGNKYPNESFVYVANESTIERQRASGSDADGPIKRSDNDWVARVLEIRASDEHHVYARVCWMYSPDELPPGTFDGRKTISGRQPYHGHSELIASNHMDVINVVSVTMPATVNQWNEEDDEEIQSALYWRQAFDCRTSELSTIELICKCKRPANPDKTLIGCSKRDCTKWLHYECLVDDILGRTFERLGTDKPHVLANGVKQEVEEEKNVGPLTPTELVNGENRTVKPMIDVQGGETAKNLPVRELDGVVPKKTETPPPLSVISATPTESNKQTTKRGRKKASEDKPYEGLFEASLKMSDGPMIWEISDLRENVKGGEKVWTERAECLLCGTTIE